MRESDQKIIFESYCRILQYYPSIEKLLTEDEIKVINKFSSKLYNYQINDSSVIYSHQILLDSKTSMLSKKLSVPIADIRNFIMNSSGVYSEVINPVMIEESDVPNNLQSGLYIKRLESDIYLLNHQHNYYLKRTDRVRLAKNLYKVYENELEISPHSCNVIYDFLKRQHIDRTQTSKLTESQEQHIQKQALYALWEYTNKYPDNDFPVERWIFYRSRNNNLYSNDEDNTFLKSDGKLIIESENEKYENLDWYPVKHLMFKNRR